MRDAIATALVYRGQWRLLFLFRALEPGSHSPVPAKKKRQEPLSGEALIKEVCRRIRFARTLWDAHRNAACRGERTKAIALYETLTDAQREKVPQALRVWLRYRSEKYFGEGR
jgi:hypothetical protein